MVKDIFPEASAPLFVAGWRSFNADGMRMGSGTRGRRAWSVSFSPKKIVALSILDMLDADCPGPSANGDAQVGSPGIDRRRDDTVPSPSGVQATDNPGSMHTSIMGIPSEGIDHQRMVPDRPAYKF